MIRKLTLIIFVILVVTTHANATDCKGYWMCESTNVFGYRYGKIEHYDNESFSLIITDHTVAYSGSKGNKNINKGKLTRFQDWEICSAYDHSGVFSLTGGKFAWTEAFTSLGPTTFNFIGTCEKRFEEESGRHSSISGK